MWKNTFSNIETLITRSHVHIYMDSLSYGVWAVKNSEYFIAWPCQMFACLVFLVCSQNDWHTIVSCNWQWCEFITFLKRKLKWEHTMFKWCNTLRAEPGAIVDGWKCQSQALLLLIPSSFGEMGPSDTPGGGERGRHCCWPSQWLEWWPWLLILALAQCVRTS